MNDHGTLKQTMVPVLTVLVAAGVSYLGYFGSRSLNNESIHQIMAFTFGTAYFLSVAFGALYVYVLAYVRGVTLPGRILASMAVPFIWMSKEVLRLTESHPFIECLYWYFNPLNIWLTSLVVLEMGVATLIARLILKRRGQRLSIVTPSPIAVILGSLTFVISAYAWGKGENLYVIFLNGYRVLFGSGI